MKRISRTKLNITAAVLQQVVSGVCGLILPRFVLLKFGSEANGLIASVSQFLGYTVLLEGGIGGVMKAALYKPLADGDEAGISGIFIQIRQTFRKISRFYICFALILAICMKFFVDTQFDWFYVFTMVLILSTHTFFNYYAGLPHRLLMSADQRLYVIQFTQIAAIVLNLLLCILVMKLGGSIHAVKLTSVTVFLLNPLVQRLYVKRHYTIRDDVTASTKHIQKHDALVHHLAYFIHGNTDVVILSLAGSLNTVSVYTVYKTVINVLQQLVLSVSSGISGLVGQLLAQKEIAELNRIVERYELYNNILTTAVATICAIMILPYVSFYTGGVTDVDYHQPVFAVLIIAASYAYSIRHPFNCVVSAAGHYKQTKAGAIGEVAINLGLSLLLVKPMGLVGVAMGTFLAMAFRTLYTVWYLSENILHRPVYKFLLRLACNVAVSVVLIYKIPDWISVSADDIIRLLISAVKVSLVVVPVFIIVNLLVSMDVLRKNK